MLIRKDIAIENIEPDSHMNIVSLQRLYVAMDEPDGVLGVAAIRQTPSTLMQQILTHESLGMWLAVCLSAGYVSIGHNFVLSFNFGSQ